MIKHNTQNHSNWSDNRQQLLEKNALHVGKCISFHFHKIYEVSVLFQFRTRIIQTY